MRLPADRREWLETLCRTGVFVMLAYLILQTLLPEKRATRETAVSDVPELASLTTIEAPARIHFALKGMPGVVQRDWFRALRSAGSQLSWSGSVQPIAIAAKPSVRPDRGYSINAYSAGTSLVKLADALSVVDSANVGTHFISASVAVGAGKIGVSSGSDSASAALTDSVVLRPVLVIGKAGWETKFVLAALEEARWKTDALISIAPSVNATQGAYTSIDTAHYSAIVALDGFAASRSRDLVSFVRSGGGLILGADAARAQEFSALRVSGSPPAAHQPVLMLDTISRASAPFTALDIKPNAVALEQRGGQIATAAMRVGFGRVAQLGYDETWRWRMQGSRQSLVDHRDWWSALISQVAYAPRISKTLSSDNRVPYASLVEIAGAPSPTPVVGKRLDAPTSQLIWIIVLSLLLIVEWTSRRLRGVR
jgi:hypothetical protein